MPSPFPEPSIGSGEDADVIYALELTDNILTVNGNTVDLSSISGEDPQVAVNSGDILTINSALTALQGIDNLTQVESDALEAAQVILDAAQDAAVAAAQGEVDLAEVNIDLVEADIVTINAALTVLQGVDNLTQAESNTLEAAQLSIDSAQDVLIAANAVLLGSLVADTGESVGAGESVIARDNKRVYINNTASAIVLTGVNAATLVTDGLELVNAGGSGATTVLGLTDAPATYVAQGGKFLAVKSTEDGLEFVDAPAGGGEGGSTYVSSWTHALSEGDRSADITVTAVSGTAVVNDPQVLVDGTLGTSFYFQNDTDVTDQGLEYTFAEATKLSGIRQQLDNLSSAGSAIVKVQYKLASGDAWSDCLDMTPSAINTGSGNIFELLFSVPEATRFYRFVGASGGFSNTPYWLETTFRVEVDASTEPTQLPTGYQKTIESGTLTAAGADTLTFTQPTGKTLINATIIVDTTVGKINPAYYTDNSTYGGFMYSFSETEVYISSKGSGLMSRPYTLILEWIDA